MRRLADEDSDDIAALIRANLASLIAERAQINAERADLELQRAGWEAAQRTLADLDTWISTVADNLDAADYATRRLALDALAVSVRLWPAHHTPRWDVQMQVGIVATTSRTCSGRRHEFRPGSGARRAHRAGTSAAPLPPSRRRDRPGR
jgi:hypothetical protein